MGDIFLLGISVGGLAIFFQTCMADGLIFEFWHTFLLNTFYYKTDKITHQVTEYTSKIRKGFYKILGGCVYCNAFYVALLVWIWIIPAPVAYFFPYIGVVELTIHVYNKYVSA